MNKLSLRMLSVCSALIMASGTAVAGTDSMLVTANVQTVATVALGVDASFNVTPGIAVSDQDLGNMSINCNSATGYTVSLEGTNATSVLEFGAETLAYTVKYNGGSAQNMTTTPVVVENVNTPTAGIVTRTFTLDISAGASGGKPTGAYTDTITATITAQ